MMFCYEVYDNDAHDCKHGPSKRNRSLLKVFEIKLAIDNMTLFLNFQPSHAKNGTYPRAKYDPYSCRCLDIGAQLTDHLTSEFKCSARAISPDASKQ